MVYENQLSICIPTYNRNTELKFFFESVDYIGDDIEFVICDDGSTDNTKASVYEFSTRHKIQYIYQDNQGRSVALKNSIEHATGNYTILMDSDDYFLPGALELIVTTIKKHFDHECFLFGVQIKRGDTYTNNLPLDNLRSNYIALRADIGLKKDFKEVVKTDLIKSCLYKVPNGCRRVPTSFLWAKVAEKSDCLTFSDAVAVKEYLPGGMSDKILQLKTAYPEPLIELNELLIASKCYKSKIYRWRCRLLWARYAFHAHKVNVNAWWKPIVVPFGFGIYLIDIYKLKKSTN